MSEWGTAMTSLTGGGGTSSGERGATWSDRESARRGGGMTGPTGELTWRRLRGRSLDVQLAADTELKGEELQWNIRRMLLRFPWKQLQSEVPGVSFCFREWDRSRERRRDYERGRRERFSPPRHMSPQHKRMRRDWWVPLFSTSGRVQSTRLLCYRRERT